MITQKNHKYMSLLAAACLFGTISCGGRNSASKSHPASINQPVGQYRGYQTINSTLQSVLLDPLFESTKKFDFTFFAVRGGLILANPSGLQPLLGTWTPGGVFGGGGDSVYINGTPTALSAYLYEVMMGNLSERLGLACTQDVLTFATTAGSGNQTNFVFQKDFLLTARAFCAATSEAEGRAAARKLWQLLIGYEFDDSFETLFDLVQLTPDFWTLLPEQRLQLLMNTLLLHPVFLLSY